MKHPSTLSINAFSYELPENRIAKYPLAQRDASKLLVYQSGKIQEKIYRQLAEEIPANSLLVFNNTKVVEARLIFKKETGSTIEIFCLEPDDRYADITSAMLQKGKVYWKCLVGGAKKWKSGSIQCIANLNGSSFIIEAKKISVLNDYFLIELSWTKQEISFAELLHIAGNIPLPPYLNRPTEVSDKDRYQTIYAQYDGSVAAPTAGLHFTDAIFKSLQAKNIQTHFVTLHVGAGTFKPVVASIMKNHEMHAEFIEVQIEFIQLLLQQINKDIIAVGTTSLRTLETLYWLGVKTILNPSITNAELTISQWDPYDLAEHAFDASTALTALIHWMHSHDLQKLFTKTQIIIAPGFRFNIINGLITNFHQPKSTLLLIVAAITGDDWLRIYQYAIEHEFRFLSYGDGSLLWINKN